MTAFERITDGLLPVGVGDLVRLATKPQVVGRVLHFSVPQVRGRFGRRRAPRPAGSARSP